MRVPKKAPMKIITAMLLTLASSSIWAEEVYRDVSDDGVPSFSDQAMPGAEPITLREPSTFTDTTYQQNLRKQQSVESPTPKKIDYKLLVTNPLDDSAIRNNAGNIGLTLSISPSVKPGHRAELMMDGIKIRDVLGNGIVELTNVDRGTHAFNMRVIDEGGDVVTEGPTNNISVLRYSLPRKSPR